MARTRSATVRRRDCPGNAERAHGPANGSVHRADRVSRSTADTPRDCQFPGRSKRSDRPGGFFDRGRAGEHRLRRRDEYYGGEKEYIFALAEALRQEYLEIHQSGLLLQVDDAVLANMYDHLVQQSPEPYREWAQLRVDALNHALRDIPEDRVRYHVCFGSWHVPHLADAALGDITYFILQVRAGAYSIEAANPRHEHEWRWRSAPTRAKSSSIWTSILRSWDRRFRS